MIIDPAKIARKERYKLLIGTIVPRPIALVSTISKTVSIISHRFRISQRHQQNQRRLFLSPTAIRAMAAIKILCRILLIPVSLSSIQSRERLSAR
jgi:hypothetical protein